jgi:hypothetical protein
MKKIILIKGKLKNNILKVKFALRHLMLSQRHANQIQVEFDYINYIIISTHTRVIYELKLSGHISENPLFRFEVKQKEIQVGDKLEIKWTTHLGVKEHWSIEIQESFNSKKTRCKDELALSNPRWAWEAKSID